VPRCTAGVALLSATSLPEFMSVFAAQFAACWHALLMESTLSLATAVGFFLLTLGFAKGGGVGAVSGERQAQQQQQAQAQRARTRQQRRQAQQQQSVAAAPAATSGLAGCGGGIKQARKRSPVVGPLVKLRTGGSACRLLVALAHAGAHLSLAIVLLLLLELGVEVCIK
jgi:hypothetical protein